MQNTKQRNQGFTLIELLVVIAIIGILAGATFTGVAGVKAQGQMTRSLNNIKQICTALRTFANENDGWYPTEDNEGGEFTSSTQAFDFLLKSGSIDTEGVFWMKTKHPDKSRRAPEENNILLPEENVYGYVAGLSDTSFSLSPLVFEGLMDGPGTYGEFHPWLNKGKAVIGFVDTHVSTMNLTSREAGATVRDDSGKIDDIFQRRQVTSDGASGGYLDAEPDAVLLP